MTALNRKIIIGIVTVLGVVVILFLVGAAFALWKTAQRAGNEAAAQQELKTIAAGEIQYYHTHNRTFGTLDQLIKEGMLTSKFSGNPPVADGYVFKVNIMPRTSSQSASYALNADPQSAKTGRNHFYLDSTDSRIHVNPDQPASANDPPADE